MLTLPPRAAGAPGGEAFATECEHLGPADREAAIEREILAGNVPAFLRRLTRVPVGARAAVWVIPDYLAIGSDDDFLRIPMTKGTAHRIARALGCVLPTTRIVDAIYASATCKLTSPPHGASAVMATTQLYVAHNREIEERRAASHCPRGALLAGPKKDLVISVKEAWKPGKLIIYGWFHDDGTPIQPLSWLHSDKYVDFSHGVRLVADEMEIDGRPHDVFDVLRDPALAPLVSDEGPFAQLEP